MSERPALSGAVLDGLPDAVIVADRSGLIRYVNERACRLVGRSRDELLGTEVAGVVPERFRAAHRAGFARFVSGGRARIAGIPTRLPVLRADGEEHDVDLILSTADAGDGDEVLVVASLRDVASQLAMERKVAASHLLAASVEVTERLHRAHTVQEGLSAVLPTLCAHLDWDLATMWSREPDGDALRCIDVWRRPGSRPAALLEQASLRRRFRPGEGLPGRVLEEAAPVVADLTDEAVYPRLRAAAAAGMRCAVALPLVTGKEVLGVIELYKREPTEIPDEMITMMEAVGRQIGQFIDRLQGEQQLRELSDALQASLLPPRPPEIPGLELETLYRSGVAGLSVGGDVFDLFPAGSGRWVLLIGDVCGKGVAAASTTAVARYTARAAAIDHPHDPARVLETVNEALLRDSVERPFLTAACAVIDPSSSGAAVRLAVAGHPLPLLVGRDGRVSEIGVPGSLLGILEQVEVVSVDVDLRPGETALFFTDGLIEARDGHGAQFGDERVHAMLAAGSHEPLPRLVHGLARAATRFAGGAPQDDMAIVALRPQR